LRRLRERQDSSAIVPTISDILVEQFSGECGAQLERAYGTYCSQHKHAVSLYKENLQRDRRFQVCETLPENSVFFLFRIFIIKLRPLTF
jgi:hypothetical protein